MVVDNLGRFCSRQFRRADLVTTTVRDFRNPFEVLRHLKTGLPLRRLQVRGGPVIHAPAANPLYIVFQEVWRRKVYTQGGFSINPNSVVMDIGANVGVFSLFAARISGVRVYAFEPHPENYEYLQRNVQLNEAPVSCFRLAVAGESGTRQMWLTPESGGHRLYDRTLAGRLDQCIEVGAQPLATIMHDCNISYVDFLKMDCEGAEYEILFNSTSSCLKRIGMISMEFHDHITPHSHQEIARFLEGHGFGVRVPEVDGTFGILQAWQNHRHEGGSSERSSL